LAVRETFTPEILVPKSINFTTEALVPGFGSALKDNSTLKSWLVTHLTEDEAISH
jgi:hypothetical protein